ncbi:sensor domain-containing phosphodiesterase [Nocardioides pacificus]
MHATAREAARQQASTDWEYVEDVLALARKHLQADLVWMSSLDETHHEIRVSSGHDMDVAVAKAAPFEGSYCTRVLSGQLPPVIPDARHHPVARELPITTSLGIGSYIGIPWHDADGRVGGMVCSLSRDPKPGMGGEEQRFLSVIAELISNHVRRLRTDDWHAAQQDSERVRRVLETRDVRMALQPVIRLRDGVVVGYESLARFSPEVFPSPVHAFAAATRADLGVELELLAAQKALQLRDQLPPDVWLSVNLSADALVDDAVQATLLAHEHPGLGVELTEHVQVSDYAELTARTDQLRAAGISIVVDDAGAGFASFSHILRVSPDVIKLDLDLTRDVDSDKVRRALTRALVDFARDTEAPLVAEGIETQAELETLRELGVDYGQGYLLGRPAFPPLP